MSREFHRNLLIGLVTLIFSLLIIFHGFQYNGIKVLPMVVDYLVGSIIFIYSMSRFKKAIKRRS